MVKLTELFKAYTNNEPEQVQLIAGSGSNRQYYRLSNSSISLIGVYGQVKKENKAFIEISKVFNECNINSPQVLSVSDCELYYLTTDLGDKSLFFDFINKGYTAETIELLKKTISTLPKIQFEVGSKLNFENCFPQAEFDKRGVLWDLNYFKYLFLKQHPIEFDEQLLENDFETFYSLLSQDNSNCFLYRDFQSRNIIIKDDEPYFIDFQGGRKGPIYYDLVSFLYQAKAAMPDDIKQDLIRTYIASAQEYIAINESEFIEKFNLFAVFRTMQVLGAYGFRGLIENKAHFIESIPFAIDNLRKLLAENELTEMPYLKELLVQLTQQYPALAVSDKTDKLVVKVFSFSYKKGIPKDYSGNGGGFVFDCRAIHNPGRYKEYKQLTGLDQPVIEFLEKEDEMAAFLENIYSLADASVSRYIERGFSSLMFSFGCTGGQHRSVYGAQHLAEYISNKYDCIVELNHREQNIMINY